MSPQERKEVAISTLTSAIAIVPGAFLFKGWFVEAVLAIPFAVLLLHITGIDRASPRFKKHLFALFIVTTGLAALSHLFHAFADLLKLIWLLYGLVIAIFVQPGVRMWDDTKARSPD